MYVLSDQKTPEQFAGQRVKVTGTLYEKTRILTVDSMTDDGQVRTATAKSSRSEAAHSGHQH